MNELQGKLILENETLRLGLAFYANPNNWRQGNHHTPILYDNGEHARAVLAMHDEDITESQRRALAFLNALAECDSVTRIRFMKYIGAMAYELRRVHGIDEVEAIEQAAEFFSAVVWKKVQVPERSER